MNRAGFGGILALLSAVWGLQISTIAFEALRKTDADATRQFGSLATAAYLALLTGTVFFTGLTLATFEGKVHLALEGPEDDALDNFEAAEYWSYAALGGSSILPLFTAGYWGVGWPSALAAPLTMFAWLALTRVWMHQQRQAMKARKKPTDKQEQPVGT